MMATTAFAADAMTPATQGGAAIQSGASTFQKDASVNRDASLNRNVYQDKYYDTAKGSNDGSENGVFYHDSYNQGNRAAAGTTSASGECCGQDTVAYTPADTNAGECWCLMCHQEPCYYNTYRCVEKPVYTTKKCCRYVPKYYEVQRCKYVPQYYTETKCEQCPEYYDVEECTTCKEWVCDRQCKYVPKYYWKHTCGQTAPCDQATADACCGR